MKLESTSVTPGRGAEADRGGDGVAVYFAAACGVTWLLAVPAALAWMDHRVPPPNAVACAGLSAFGPTLAAFVVASARGERRDVFGRWRTNPMRIAGALLAAPAVHVAAVALYAALGGGSVPWLHPPVKPEQWAALLVFPIGEEFGWRGFAHPRMARRLGLVKGSLVVGAVWGLWHLMYAITPGAARFDVVEFVTTMIELPMYSLPIAWAFERSGRSMAVAVAFHAGAHLDHIEPATRGNLLLYASHMAVLAAVAALAAKALARMDADGGERSARPLGLT